MFQPNDGFQVPHMPIAGRQTRQLCARKAGHYEARRLSHAFGKGELNLGIAPTRTVEANLAAATTMTGTSSMRRYDPSCVCASGPRVGCKRDQPADDGRV